MVPPAIPIRSIKIIYTVCPAVAVIITGTRLWMRASTGRIWWDDRLALMSAIFIILTAVGGWMHFDAPSFDSQVTRVAAYYLLAQAFYGTLWCARLSILYSIIRVASNPLTKKILHWLCAAFVFAWLILFCQLWWVCIPMHNHWTSLPSPQCPLPLQVAVLQLVSDILADIMLIVVPVRLFLNSQLEVGTKTRLVIIFSASILTTVVSLVHAYYILKVGGADVLIAAIVEVSISLIVCNLAVLVTTCTRACGPRKGSIDGSGDDRIQVSIPSWRSTKNSRQGELTTIGLTTFSPTEITVQKESATFFDSEHQLGKGRVDRPVAYYEAENDAKMAYLQLEAQRW